MNWGASMPTHLGRCGGRKKCGHLRQENRDLNWIYLRCSQTIVANQTKLGRRAMTYSDICSAQNQAINLAGSGNISDAR